MDVRPSIAKKKKKSRECTTPTQICLKKVIIQFIPVIYIKLTLQLICKNTTDLLKKSEII
jgi:hypothetical protein